MEKKPIVEFSPSSVIGLEKVTNVNKLNIYKMNVPQVRYTIITERIKYVGVMRRGILHIFNLIDDNNFSELDLERIRKIPKLEMVEFDSRVSTMLSAAIPKFLLIKLRGIDSLPTFYKKNIDLGPAKDTIAMLNTALNEFCPGFTLSIDYIFNFPPQTLDTLEHPILSTLEDPLVPESLLLGLFYHTNCVAYLSLDIRNGIIQFEPKTHEDYRRRKFSKLLTAVIIIIGSRIDSATGVSCLSTNPISVYLMKNTFHATSNYPNIDDLDTFDEIKGLMDAYESADNGDDDSEDEDDGPHTYLVMSTVALNEENTEHAFDVFETTLTEEIKCAPVKAKGKKKKSKKNKPKKMRKSVKKRRY